MTKTRTLRRLGASIFSALLLTACAASDSSTPADTDALFDELPPLRTLLSCLPDGAAIVAAHRGTDERWDVAENSVGGLKRLISEGIHMAEIDLAGLRDGTLITFHDGVWDEMTTGTGPIASSTKEDLESILLETRDGRLTAERPPTFDAMLEAAGRDIYLEIDFKSSAKFEPVIEAIRDAGLSDHVVLIAYTEEQAAKLDALAPEMFRSNPSSLVLPGHGVWLGYNVANDDTAQNVRSAGGHPIGRIGDPNRQPPLAELIKASDILVTDAADDFDGIIGLTDASRAELKSCLAK